MGEVVDHTLTKEDAEQLTQGAAKVFGGQYQQLAVLRSRGVHKLLGFDDFSEYVHKRIGGYVRMSIEERRQAAKELAEQGMSTREIAGVLGTHHSTVAEDLKYVGNPTDEASGASPEAKNSGEPVGNPTDDDVLADDDDPEPVNPVAAKRKANEDARKAILETPADPKIEEGLHVGDFFELADRIEDESVDLVFTDPPYDKSSVDLYRKAAKVAARILKPGGSFVAYTGQKYLPEVYGLINNPALRYWWTFAGVHAEGRQMLQRLGIRCGWKPILWYVKGTRGDVSKVLADVVTGAREKSHHEWQQAEAEALHFIEKLCPEGGLVVDFFLGGGTTAVAAQKLGRRWIGFEINQETAAKARSRIEETKK